jgi:signal transduction histidine kinase
MEEIKFADLLSSSIQRYQNLFPDILINKKINSSGEIKGDAQLLSAVCNNLIENSIKYSKKEKEITIELNDVDHHLILKVSDKGIGISLAEKQRIFEKFYRVGNEETRKTKGTGLGLYIVKNIVKLHSGSVDVKSELGEGSTFIVKIPKG